MGWKYEARRTHKCDIPTSYPGEIKTLTLKDVGSLWQCDNPKCHQWWVFSEQGLNGMEGLGWSKIDDEKAQKLLKQYKEDPEKKFGVMNSIFDTRKTEL